LGEVADLCERVGADIEEVAHGMGLDHRIGTPFLRAGPGYGGSCFPKDTVALLGTAKRCDVALKIVETVVHVNAARKQAMVDRIVSACGGSVRGKSIALLGLAFKANTDDMREAPSLVIVSGLQKAGAKLRAYDPAARRQARRWLPELDTVADVYTCLDGADAAVIVTEWDEFKTLDLEKAKRALRSPVVIDLRNMYQPGDMASRGFTYISIGRSLQSTAAGEANARFEGARSLGNQMAARAGKKLRAHFADGNHARKGADQQVFARHGVRASDKPTN
jgi:UDPglucose 6-dehydrogenase